MFWKTKGLFSFRVTSRASGAVKYSPAHSGGLGSTPGSGRPPAEGNDSPLRCSCLESPMDRGDWRAAVRGVPEESGMTVQPHNMTNYTLAVPLSGRPPRLHGARVPRRLSARRYLLSPTRHSFESPQAFLKQRTPVLRTSSPRLRPRSSELVLKDYRPRDTCRNSCFTSGVSKCLSFLHTIHKISTHT